jgi:hypothetical protein
MIKPPILIAICFLLLALTITVCITAVPATPVSFGLILGCILAAVAALAVEVFK